MIYYKHNLPLVDAEHTLRLGAKNRFRHWKRFFYVCKKIIILKTIVYIDAQNLYFGVLKNSPYKWLDIFKLFSYRVVKHQNSDAEIIKVKFYTAPVLGKFAKDSQCSVERQDKYHRALKACYPDKICIINGFYQDKCIPAMRCKSVDEKALVWKIEEKQTDVNLALDMYRDVLNNICEQVVLCSNDSDLEPALKNIKEDCPSKRIGVVYPIKKTRGSRRRSKVLCKHADWVRHHLSDNDLSLCQLPEKIVYKLGNRSKKILKPDEWN
ncbi:MAG: NYN domain-containing protein [Gammaproteobacteria bacterium]|nr:NYN domain-containing protein [Gammaproteobacteria bacterium]